MDEGERLCTYVVYMPTEGSAAAVIEDSCYERLNESSSVGVPARICQVCPLALYTHSPALLWHAQFLTLEMPLKLASSQNVSNLFSM